MNQLAAPCSFFSDQNIPIVPVTKAHNKACHARGCHTPCIRQPHAEPFLSTLRSLQKEVPEHGMCVSPYLLQCLDLLCCYLLQRLGPRRCPPCAFVRAPLIVLTTFQVIPSLWIVPHSERVCLIFASPNNSSKSRCSIDPLDQPRSWAQRYDFVRANVQLPSSACHVAPQQNTDYREQLRGNCVGARILPTFDHLGESSLLRGHTGNFFGHSNSSRICPLVCESGHAAPFAASVSSRSSLYCRHPHLAFTSSPPYTPELGIDVLIRANLWLVVFLEAEIS
mmetsp:Transcript_56494/g.115625  ORF Transcript_56494/g.115625 Transcript_56494/m.115625 type:complete len:280 (-) Transcript_56494:1511-2350(-)